MKKTLNYVVEYADATVQTKQDEFLKLHPYANMDMDDVLCICPHDIDYRVECLQNSVGFASFVCDTCRKKYWTEQ